MTLYIRLNFKSVHKNIMLFTQPNFSLQERLAFRRMALLNLLYEMLVLHSRWLQVFIWMLKNLKLGRGQSMPTQSYSQLSLLAHILLRCMKGMYACGGLNARTALWVVQDPWRVELRFKCLKVTVSLRSSSEYVGAWWELALSKT